VPEPLDDLPEIAIRCLPYRTVDARHDALAARAWRRLLGSGEAKLATSEQRRRLYEANPSGESVVAVAEEAGEWIGLVAALATDVVDVQGRLHRALQIGDFMVDERRQGRGVGVRLLGALTGALSGLGRPVYTFPNRRSIGVFRKLGYCEVRTIPAVLFARRGLGGGRRRREVSLGEACALADALGAPGDAGSALRKDGAYLRWRYGEIREPADYRYVLAEAADDAVALVVSCRHRFRGVPFAVVTDAWLRPGFRDALRCAAGGAVGFSHVERDSAWRLPVPFLRVPERADPRPVRLLVPPDAPDSQRLFGACRFSTGDWMGF
jgi:GNAT superfamily N-acetyltransferase